MLFALGIFLIFTFIIFMVALSYEDAMLHKVLRNAAEDKIPQSGIIKEVSIDQLLNMGYSEFATKSQLKQRVNKFGEFPRGESYYHFMVLKDRVLLLDSTEFVIARTEIESITKIILKGVLPFLLVIFWIAHLISKRALKPFSELSRHFLHTDNRLSALENLMIQVKEDDIREIIQQLADTIKQQESILEQQITFNKGLSHELRTPVQVMTHSIELMALKQPELLNLELYKRLEESLKRMHRTSEAMMWLTSEQEFSGSIKSNEKVKNSVKELEFFYSERNVVIDLKEQGQLNLAMPEIVFEFIIYCLINNVIHHGQPDIDNTLKVDIVVTNTTIHFINKIKDINSFEKEQNEHSGIGLMLIDKLCKRFNVQSEVSIRDSKYEFKLF